MFVNVVLLNTKGIEQYYKLVSTVCFGCNIALIIFEQLDIQLLYIMYFSKLIYFPLYVS